MEAETDELHEIVEGNHLEVKLTRGIKSLAYLRVHLTARVRMRRFHQRLNRLAVVKASPTMTTAHKFQLLTIPVRISFRMDGWRQVGVSTGDQRNHFVKSGHCVECHRRLRFDEDARVADQLTAYAPFGRPYFAHRR